MVNGGTPAADELNWGGEIPWATPIDVGRRDGLWLDDTDRTITDAGLSSGSAAVPAGSCLLSTRAPIGYTALVRNRTAFNQGCKGVVARRDVESRFLLYTLLEARGRLVALGQGSTFAELSTASLGSLRVAIPSRDTQRVIADYLDNETAEIDAFIADQEELIALLEERRGRVARHLFTTGGSDDLELVDSGVEWIGRVPRDWRIIPIRRLTAVKRGASPRPIDDPKYFDEGGYWSWVRIQDVTSSAGRLHETAQRLSELGSSLSVRLLPGSLFLSIAATVGRPCIAEIPCCIHDGFVYFPGLSKDLVPYLYRIFETGTPFAGLGKMGTQLNLNTEIVGEIVVPVPPPGVLPRLLGALDHHLAEANAAIADAREAIALSKERRAALISAAVTGQIDVTARKRVLV